MDALRGPFPAHAPRSRAESEDVTEEAPPPDGETVSTVASGAQSPAAPSIRRRALRLIRRTVAQPAELYDGELRPPERNYDCAHYETCLDLAAALDWRSFTCKGCCGQYDEKLLWRAQHALRKNPGLAKLLSLPKPEVNDGAEEPEA